MRDTVVPVVTWPRWPYVAWADSDLAAPWYHFAQNYFTLFFGDLSDTSGDTSPDPAKTHPASPAGMFEAHYQRVRKACPKDRLLEFNLGDGWDKLCPFLGVDQPEGPYPRINDGPFFTAFHASILDRATWWAVQKVVAGLVPVAAVVGAVYYFRGQGRLRL